MENQEAEKPEVPEARIVSDLPITADVEIKFPVEFDGKVYSSITLRRPSGKEVDDYIEGVMGEDRSMPPGVDCPREVWDTMLDDDQFAVSKRYDADFFPQRLKLLGAYREAKSDSTSDLSPPPSQPQSQP